MLVNSIESAPSPGFSFERREISMASMNDEIDFRK